MAVNWIKVGGFAVSVVSAGLGIADSIISKKKIVADLANSKEVNDLIAEKVAEALKNVNK